MNLPITETVTMGDLTFNVVDLPDDLQRSVASLDEWRQREHDISSDLLMVQVALQSMYQSITTRLQEYVDNKAKEQAA